MLRTAAILFSVSLVLVGPAAGVGQQRDFADITLVSSRVNQLAYEKQGKDYRGGIKFWSSLCEDAGLSYRIAGDYELEIGPGESQVYLLHLTEQLSEAQLKNLDELLVGGASIILVGMVGARSADGGARISLSEKWFDLKAPLDYIPKDSAYFAARGGTLLALGNEPGYRFEFDWEGRYTLARSAHAQAINVDWGLHPYPDPEEPGNNAVAAVRTVGKSRLVWFGVNPDAVITEGPEHEKLLRDTLVNVLKWAARRPVAAACHWPQCHLSAAVVTADVEDKFANGDAIALACHKEKTRGSFFLVGSMAPEYPEVVAALAQNGEVGTHSMRHESFKDVPFADQLAELNQGKLALQDMGVSTVQGFRPPMEEYDDNTLRAVAAAGLGFIYGNLVYDRAYPIIKRANGSNIYQFARIVPDDYNLVVQREVTDMAAYRKEYVKELMRLHEMGGLFPFSFHTNYLALKDSVDVVRSMIRIIKKKKILLATFGDLIRWMEARRHVKVAADLDERTVRIRVANTATFPVEDFAIHYFPPTDSGKVKLIATPTRGIKVRKAPREGFVIIVDLEAGEEKEILLQ